MRQPKGGKELPASLSITLFGQNNEEDDISLVSIGSHNNSIAVRSSQ